MKMKSRPHSTAPLARRRTHGFSLIESVIVLVLLFVMTMICLALYFHDEDSDKAAEEAAMTESINTPAEATPADN